MLRNIMSSGSGIYSFVLYRYSNPVLLLIPATLIALSLALASLSRGVRGAGGPFLAAVCLLFSCIVWCSEFLSIFHLFRPGPIRLLWMLLFGASAGFLFLGVRREGVYPSPGLFWPYRLTAGGLYEALVALLLASTFLIAWCAYPNTWDSMTYHLPRARHWLMNGSLSHYPTNIVRQAFLTPFAEILIAHFYALSGRIAAANLVQWLAYLGSAVSVSLIAAELRAGRAAQSLAAVIAATTPMVILESNSTQNDLLTGLFVCAATLYLLRALDRGEPVLLSMFGLCAGLACLTKATAYMFLAPHVFLVAAWSLRRWRMRLKWAAFAAVLIVSINAGHFARNFLVFSHPLGPTSGSLTVSQLSNESFSFKGLISNLSRNFALHLAAVRSPWREAVERGVAGLHKLLGVSVDEPAYTWKGASFAVPPERIDESLSGNPSHTLLGLMACFLVIVVPALRSNRAAVALVSIVTAGLILFCLYLRWQPWHTRLHVPLFLLLAPLIALSLEFLGRGRQYLGIVAAALLTYQAAPFVLRHQLRPLLGPDSVLFVRGPRQLSVFPVFNWDSFRQLRAALKRLDCRRVGVIAGEDDWEYPIWEAVGPIKGDVQVRHLRVANATAEAAPPEDPAKDLCALVSYASPSEEVPLNSTVFRLIAHLPPYSIYRPSTEFWPIQKK